MPPAIHMHAYIYRHVESVNIKLIVWHVHTLSRPFSRAGMHVYACMCINELNGDRTDEMKTCTVYAYIRLYICNI